MPGFVSLPYLGASPKHIRTVAWTDRDGNPVPNEIKGWDPTVDIQVSVQIEINGAAVMADCEMPADLDHLRLIGWWRSSGTGVRGTGPSETVVRSHSVEPYQLDMHVPGAEIMESVELTTALVLPSQLGERSPLGAWRSGSVLWSDKRTIQIGGRGGRFPTEWTAFSASGQFHAEAGWQLDWNPEDLDAPTLGGLRLYLNSESSRILDTVSAAATNPGSELVKYLHYDVARTLLTGVLSNTEFGTDDYEPDSVGSTMFRLFTAVFPGEAVDQVRSRLKDSTARFDSELQGRLRLLREPAN